MAFSELVDIVDEHNTIIGTTDVKTAHEQKIMHRVVGIFLFDPKGNLYLQTGNKYGKLDITVGGHVQSGESYKNAAKREMAEEINLSTPLKHISTFLPEEARLNHFWSLYTATAPQGWLFEKTEEVDSLECFPVLEVISLMQNEPEKLTYGLSNTLRELLRVRPEIGR